MSGNAFPTITHGQNDVFLCRHAVVNVKATAWLKGVAVETSMDPANSYVSCLRLFWIRTLQPSASADYWALDGCHTP